MKLNSLKFLLAAVFILTLCSSKKAFAAVPTLSYTPATNTYTINTAITTLTPTSSGVGTLGSFGTPVSFGSGYSGPQDVAIDPSGNVYVTNLSNSTVRKFTSAGTFVSTWGTGLNQPYDISFDAAGNAYITNYAANTITKTTTGNVSSTFISTGLTNPFGTAVDAAGNVYVANYNGGGAGGAILKYNSAGTLIQTITTASPTNVAVDANGNIYALSYGNGTVTGFHKAVLAASAVRSVLQ
jgi:sugar lactone lactonase YvrE